MRLIERIAAALCALLVLAVSASIAVILMISGLYYFRRMERTFADEI